jgi:hypothetical protein
MSFDAVRNYARHILRPLGLLDEAAPLPARRTPALPPSTSAAWQSSTHAFLGASNRSVPKSWPLERFDDDPAAIVEDRAHDIVYDPQSAELRAAAGADSPDASFWLYERERKPAGARPEEVPAPWLVAKRYTPSQSGTSAAQQPGVTLLLLPGMGVPKEVSRNRSARAYIRSHRRRSANRSSSSCCRNSPPRASSLTRSGRWTCR